MSSSSTGAGQGAGAGTGGAAAGGGTTASPTTYKWRDVNDIVIHMLGNVYGESTSAMQRTTIMNRIALGDGAVGEDQEIHKLKIENLRKLVRMCGLDPTNVSPAKLAEYLVQFSNPTSAENTQGPRH